MFLDLILGLNQRHSSFNLTELVLKEKKIENGIDLLCTKIFLPPIHQLSPLFSTNTSHNAAELAAVALVSESPTAATISISPAWIIFSNYSQIVKAIVLTKPGLN